MRKISEDQFYQLLGLVTAGREYTKLIDSLYRVYKKIAGDEAEGRFWDYMYESDLLESLKEHLPHDKVEVIWKTKVTNSQSELADDKNNKMVDSRS